jgi:hypothetical protein
MTLPITTKIQLNSSPTMPQSLVRIDATEPLEKLLDVIERDGGVVVTNFLCPELLKESMDASEFKLFNLPHLFDIN